MISVVNILEMVIAGFLSYLAIGYYKKNKEKIDQFVIESSKKVLVFVIFGSAIIIIPLFYMSLHLKLWLTAILLLIGYFGLLITYYVIKGKK